MEEPDNPITSWHLDRRVPLALIFAIVTQTAGLVWWASGLERRVEALEGKTQAVQMQAERLARLEENVNSIKSYTVEMNATLKQLLLMAPAQKP